VTISTVARYSTLPSDRASVLELLEPAARATAAEAGCEYFHALIPEDDPNTIILIEGWRNEESLAEHRRTDHFREIILGVVVPRLADRRVITTVAIFEQADVPQPG